MHTITVTGHEPGDYVHPDQKLQIIDETTGKKYELIIRSNEMSIAQTGEISLFIPIAAIRELVADKNYCVLTLSETVSEKEKQERITHLAGLRISPGSMKTQAPQHRGKKHLKG